MLYDGRMGWSVETLNRTVDKELKALPVDVRARLVRISQLIAEVGLERVGMPYVRHVSGPLWEMRMTGKDGMARALYVIIQHQRVVIVRAFTKKTQKTPRQEINMALQRAQEVLT